MVNRQVLRGAAGVVGIIALAELVGRAGFADPDYLPLVSTILARAGELAVDGEFLADVALTLKVCGIGLLIATAAGIPLGMVLGTLPGAEQAARVLVEFLRPIPSVALIPLAILIFQGQRMNVAVVVYACTWPILINTMYAMRDVDPLAKETLRAFGFGPLSVLLRVALPSAAPFIATGVRLAAGIALILAVSTELFAGGAGGIGVFLTEAGSGGGHIDVILAATLWAGVLGLLANVALARLERRLFRWHRTSTTGAS